MRRETFSAPSLDAALDKACRALRTPAEELDWHVVEETDGLVTIEAQIDVRAFVGLFIRRVFSAGGLDVRSLLSIEDGVVVGELSGEDVGLLREGWGAGLDSLQFLCNRALDTRSRQHPPVRLDADAFKSHRARRLGEMARDMASRVERNGRPIESEQLTPAARREIHVALAEHGSVETESNGTGFVKRVVVRPRRR